MTSVVVLSRSWVTLCSFGDVDLRLSSIATRHEEHSIVQLPDIAAHLYTILMLSITNLPSNACHSSAIVAARKAVFSISMSAVVVTAAAVRALTLRIDSGSSSKGIGEALSASVLE